MIKKAAVPAYERKQYTLDAVKDMQFDKDEYSKALGIKVDTQMVKFQGALLYICKIYFIRIINNLF